MTVVFHPEFTDDVIRFRARYTLISENLAARFRQEVYDAVEAIKLSPTSAGHFLQVRSAIVRQLRRRNLKTFPFFVLYNVADDRIYFGCVIPSRSDPLTWLSRFPADAV